MLRPLLVNINGGLRFLYLKGVPLHILTTKFINMGEISKNYLYNSEIFATFAAVLSVNNEFNYSQFNHFSL